jgi:phage-related minor tail protein
MAKTVNLNVKATGADKASKNLGKVDKGLGGIAKSAAKVAAGFFAARGVLTGFQKVLDATRTQILAETQLNAVLKSTAGAAGLTAKELTGMAAALQKQTRFGDEAIIKAQSLLLTFTKVGKEVFPDAIEAILNMSEAMGQDLQQGVIQVGKALNDPILGVTALRRVGVQLTKQQEELVKSFTKSGQVAEAQKIILSELETQFGGVAKAAGDTMPGALDQMRNAAGDLLETVGELSSDGIVPLTKTLTRLLEVANKDLSEKGFFGYIASGPLQSFKILANALGFLQEDVDKAVQDAEALAERDEIIRLAQERAAGRSAIAEEFAPRTLIGVDDSAAQAEQLQNEFIIQFGAT